MTSDTSDTTDDRDQKAGPDDDDPQGMKGQMDDSMNGLEESDNEDEAARGISQE